MKKFVFKIFLCVCLILSSVCFPACTEKNKNPDKNEIHERVNFDQMDIYQLEEYVSLGAYKGMNICLDGGTGYFAVWQAVKKNATIRAYPEQQVAYYTEQIRTQYRYYAEKGDISYDEVLKTLGVTENSIAEEARELAIDDVIFELVRKSENIELSTAEKSEYFDKYVKKYVEDYGYTEQYVRENLADSVFSSMLHDKVTEYLIANNTITE